MTHRSVFCIAPARDQAGRIVHDLRSAEFPSADISALLLDRDASPAPAAAPEAPGLARMALKSGQAPEASRLCLSGETPLPPGEVAELQRHPDLAPASPVALDGLPLPVLPGFAPLCAMGPIAAAFRPATVGGLAGGLLEFGVPPQEAACYEGKIQGGGVLLSVCTDNPDKSDRAREIFRAAGATDRRTMMVLVKRGTHRDPPPAGFAAPVRRRASPRLARRSPAPAVT